jgi:quercetin dioxygenase-like cupin family protein
MHVTPSEFRAVRRDGVLLHYALLDDIAYALASFPASGSTGTWVEEWCERPHWAFTVGGALELDVDGERRTLGPGTAFHLPAGVPHRLFVPADARIAGFDRVSPGTPTTEAELRKAGFDTVPRSRSQLAGSVAVQPGRPEPQAEHGEIAATTRRMGDLLFTRTRLGSRAGYTLAHCDVPHWGLVTSGSLAIESEDDVEVVTAGDVFLCRAGPPGHRLQSADPAAIVDFTPIDALDGVARVSAWRRAAFDAALADAAGGGRLELAALV